MAQPAVRRGWSIFGVPIRIHRSWFAIAAFIAWSLSTGYFPAHYPGLAPAMYWGMGTVSALLLFACVLLHELGHSFAAQRHRIPVAGVTLFLFGGVAQIVGEPKRPAVELLVALAGPLVSALIIVACAAAARYIPLHQPAQLMAVAVARYLALINLGIILFNLLPGFPLDGGRVLRALLWAGTGDFAQATRIASAVGAGLGTGLVLLGLWVMMRGSWSGGLWYVLLGWFLRRAAMASYRRGSAAVPPRHKHRA